MSAKNLVLIGDIGGTNARFALVQPGSTILENIQVLACSDYPNLEEAMQDYIAANHPGRIEVASIAFACPVHNDVIKMTNNHWVFSRSAIKAKLGLKVFKCINDFTAMALGILHVPGKHLIAVGGVSADPDKPRLIIGPGTGLGVSALVKTSGAWFPLSTEGGHVDFAPIDDQQIELYYYLKKQYKRISVERLLCGEGLVTIYKFLSDKNHNRSKYHSPAGITQAALKQRDELALAALALFCEVFGQVCGNAALASGALGGVYICGGIIPRFVDFFVASDFRSRFEDKGRMQSYLFPIPVYVVTEQYTGLLGAAEAVTNAEVQ